MAASISGRGKWFVGLVAAAAVAGAVWLFFYLQDERTAVEAAVIAEVHGVEPVQTLGARGYPSVAWTPEDEPGPQGRRAPNSGYSDSTPTELAAP